jgi:hypothetical protein
MTPRGAASLLLLAGGVLLAGCGAGTPEDVAVSYVGSNAADKCDLLTQGLVERLTGERGAAARAACRRNVVRVPAPRDVRVRGVSGGEEGGEAERRREAAGGVEAESEVRLVADGRAAEVRLVKRHERWQIAALGE